jgi:hypothetical protein
MKLDCISSAILLIIYNRPLLTNRVFNEIRKVKPARLYVAGDGLKTNKTEEVEKIFKARSITTAVDWPCEVRTLFQKKNLGCKYGVSAAIDWFFKHEQQGIILEDDCLPSKDFFYFCETLLKRYKNDERIFSISGTNLKHKIEINKESYYFSKYFLCWGWASWRRAWNYNNLELSFWPQWHKSKHWINKFTNKKEKKFWRKIFNLIYLKKIDTWDYSWQASIFKQDGLCITPNKNLVTNIGFGDNATHTKSKNIFAEIPMEVLNEIKHPIEVKQNHAKDCYIFDYVFTKQQNLLVIFFDLFKKIIKNIKIYLK